MRGVENVVSVGSGGSSFSSLGAAIEMGLVPGLRLSGLVVDQENATNTSNANRLGIRLIAVNPENFIGDNGKIDQDRFGEALNAAFVELNATFISQNGWLHKTPKNTIDLFDGRIYNQHPAPKRETAGTHGIQPHAIMIGLTHTTGRYDGTHVVVHRVDEKWDHGETVALAHVPILDSDTPKSLQEAALRYEHLLQVDHWNRVIRDKVIRVDEPTYMREGEEYLIKDLRARARQLYPHG